MRYICCLLDIYVVLAVTFSSLEGRYVKDESLTWPQPGNHEITLSPTDTLYQDENRNATKSGQTEVEGMSLEHTVEKERAGVLVELENKSNANTNMDIDTEVGVKMELEVEPKDEMKTGATQVLTKRDESNKKIKIHKLHFTYKNSQPYVPISIGSKTYQVLVDTGSGKSLISKQLFEQLKTDGQQMSFWSVRQHCDTADSRVVMAINHVANIPFEISRYPVKFPFFVAEGLQIDLLFGYDFMVKTGIMLDFRHNTLTSSNAPIQGSRESTGKGFSTCCMKTTFSSKAKVKFVRGKPATVLPVAIGNIKYEALLDSASAVSLISQKFVTILNEKGQIEKIETASALIAIGAQTTQLTERAHVCLEIGSSSLIISFFVAPATPIDLIIGYDFMSATKAMFDYKIGTLDFTKPSAKTSWAKTPRSTPE